MKTEKTNNIVDQISNVGPSMLPPMFRMRVKFKQRLYLMLIVVFIAISIGTLAFTMMGDVVNKFQIVTPAQKDLFLYSMITSTLTMLSTIAYIAWSRKKAFLISFHEFILYIISPILMTASFIYLDYAGHKTYMKFFEFLSYINVVIGSTPVILTLFINLLQVRRYKGAQRRSLATALPIMIVSMSVFTMTLLLKMYHGSETAGVIPIMGMFAVVLGGLILFLISCGITSKYVIVGAKTLWNSIRFSGGLTTLLIYTTLLSIGVKFAIGAKVIGEKGPTPLLAVIILDILLAGVFTAYAFLAGRVKNLFKTNPLFNQIILKLFIIFSAVVGLTTIQLLPQIYEARSYGKLSYAILASTSITIVVGTLVAHFTNLIVYSKYFKSVIGGMVMALAIILAIIFTISALRFGNIIMEILARKLIITFLIITTLIESTLAFTNIAYVAINLIRGEAKVHKQQKKEGIK